MSPTRCTSHRTACAFEKSEGGDGDSRTAIARLIACTMSFRDANRATGSEDERLFG
jgi:hypothetical protein